MSRKNLASLENEQDSDDRQSNSKKSGKQLIKVTSRKKLNLPRPHDSQRHSSYESSSILTSLGRLNDQLEYNKNSTRNYEGGFEILPHFTQKYLPKGSTSQQVYQQMQTIKSFKQSEILTLRVYRDQLKFICYNNHQQAPIKVSIKLLKDKAQIESLMAIQKQQITKEIQQFDTELKNIKEYTDMVLEYTEEYNQNNQILDIGKQKQIMIENIKTQITHLVKELEDQKRRNAKEIKKIQDNIRDLRIRIKDKEDRIRELKAKVCTLYIKMHSRNSSRGRSKDRNMSMSVRKFNTNKNETIRQMFIGNVQFKNYSKEIIQKVPENQELQKIKFYIKKDKLHFQCVYDKKQGIIHSSDYEYSSKGEQVPISRNSKNQQTSYQEIFTKYLMSMKFYFRSRIVGVQCRIKTDKGNKHIQIGICQSNIEHELVTLVNRKLLTLGSYWHGKQMIGISLWFTEESSHKKLESPKNLQLKNNKNMHSFQEYYT